MRSAEFQVVDPASGSRTPLPDVATWSVSPISDGSGVVQITYPAAGRNFAALRAFMDDDRDTLVMVRIDGQETPDYTCVMSEAQGDEADPAAVWTFSGRFQVVYLDQAVIYPAPGAEAITLAGGVSDATRVFGALTPGGIIAPLLAEAQARGAASLVTYASWNSDTDSNGTAWATVTTTSCSPGISILSLLNTLVSEGVLDWQMVGADLRLYNPGTLGADRTLQSPPVILHGPRDLVQAQRTFSSLSSVTAVLVAGGGGLYTDASSSDALANRGRRIEGYVSASNIADAGSLTAFADVQLAALVPGTLQVTHGLAMAGGGPLPPDDFDVNDWIWSDTGNGLERLQVQQWSCSMDANGILSGTVTLNDMVAARVVRLQDQITALTSGTTVVGTSTPAPVVADEIAPDAPTGLTAESTAYVDGTGATWAQVTAAWDAPTLNADGSVLTDLSGYNLQWAYASGQGLATQWNTVPGGVSGSGTSASWSPLVPGALVNVQVQAYDSSGNTSAWTASYEVTTAADSTPPPEPSAPVVAPYLGQLKITWDGLSSSGGPMPPDFAVTEVHVSLTPGFAPSPSTLTDMIPGAATSIASGLVYGDTYYVALVAVDRSGNASTPSAEATGVPVQAASGDIDTITVGQLTAGTLSADVTVSGRFATALTGARTEINASGLFQYASDGITVVAEISDSAIDITGTFETVGADGSFVKLWTSPGYAVLQFEPGGGMAHISLPTYLFAVGVNTGGAAEISGLTITSGKESSNDDAALQFYSESADGTVPAVLYAEFGGTIAMAVSKQNTALTSAGGLTGNPDVSQYDNTTDLNGDYAGTNPMTRQWTIPAGNAQVGTVYEIESPFSGSNGSPDVQAYGYKPNLNATALSTSGGDIVGATMLEVIGASGGWSGTVRLVLRVTAIGSGGSCDIFIDGSLGQNGNQQGGSSPTSCSFSSYVIGQSLDTTVANTIGLDSIWGAASDGQTASNYGSVFTRKGP